MCLPANLISIKDEAFTQLGLDCLGLPDLLDKSTLLLAVSNDDLRLELLAMPAMGRWAGTYVILKDISRRKARHNMGVDLNFRSLSDFAEPRTIHGLRRHLVTKLVIIERVRNELIFRESRGDIWLIRRQVYFRRHDV